MATTGNEASSLHEVAVQAEKNLEALATGLAQAGASPATVKAVTQMAEVTRQVVTALGKGQEQTSDEEPAAEEEPQHSGHDPIGNAASETSQAMQAAAAKRGS